MMDADYRYVEPVLALRCVLLRLLLNQISENGVADTGGGGGSASTSGTVEELYSTLGATLLWQAELARKAGQYQVSGASGFCLLGVVCTSTFLRTVCLSQNISACY